MPVIDGQIHMCYDCPGGGTMGDKEPVSDMTLGVLRERGVNNAALGERVLGIVFADPTPGKSRLASMPVLVMGAVEVSADRIDATPAFRDDVLDSIAHCSSPEDGVCGGVNQGVLVKLLTKHGVEATND